MPVGPRLDASGVVGAPNPSYPRFSDGAGALGAKEDDPVPKPPPLGGAGAALWEPGENDELAPPDGEPKLLLLPLSNCARAGPLPSSHPATRRAVQRRLKVMENAKVQKEWDSRPGGPVKTGHRIIPCPSTAQ